MFPVHATRDLVIAVVITALLCAVFSGIDRAERPAPQPQQAVLP